MSLGLVTAGPDIELPNTEIANNIVASPSGEIFVGSTFHSRIQKYDASGAFRKGWEIYSNGGRFCMEREKTALVVRVARGNFIAFYDFKGNLIRSTTYKGQDVGTCEPDTSIKRVEKMWTGLRITMAADPSRKIVIRRRGWHYLAPGPFPSFVIYVIGLILYVGGPREFWRQYREGLRGRPRSET